jgi:hypothetical protein
LSRRKKDKAESGTKHVLETNAVLQKIKSAHKFNVIVPNTKLCAL